MAAKMEKQAYTVQEVAALTGFSRQTVTRMFEQERGVIILGRPESMHKRPYRSIRIPRVEYERVIGRLKVK
jgi:predicted DNA-binding transcriptional regulator AlpA